MTATRMRVVFAALLAVVPVSGQDARLKEDPNAKSTAKDVSAATAVALWNTVIDPAHAAAGKCSNCHDGQGLYAFGATRAWNALIVDNVHEAGDLSRGTFDLTGLPHPKNDMAAGVLLAKPDTATRSMLRLPGKAGVIVKGVCGQFKKRLAGLREHDIVLMMNDKPAIDPAAVDVALAGNGAVELLVRRNGTDQTLRREAARDPRQAKRYLVGVTMGELEPVVRAQLKLGKSVRVYVRGVAKDGAAAAAGFKPYDIIVKVNGKPMADTESVQAVIQQSKGKRMSFELLRDGEPRKVNLKARLTPTVTNLAIPATEHFAFTTRDFSRANVASTDAHLARIDRKLAELMKLIKSLKQEEE